MKLRTIGLIVTLALGLLAGPLPTEAQQAGKVYRIGYLSRASAQAYRRQLDVFSARDARAGIFGEEKHRHRGTICRGTE